MAARIAGLLALFLLAGCEDQNPVTRVDASPPDAMPPVVCQATGEPVSDEVCDGRDNDCDGKSDEGFDTQNDVEHCGQCNNVCDYDNTIVACANGTCLAIRCPEGTYDTDSDLTNGCEGRCNEEDIGPELCDGMDNDCDGDIDESFDRNNNVLNCGQCDNVCRFDNAQPFCDGGRCRIRQCDPGWGDLDGNPDNGCEDRCNPQAPGPEQCDDEDNDCDGRTDEIFDLQTDPENCGACLNLCGFANAAARCEAGTCAMGNCDPGFVNVAGATENGCEQRCTVIGDGLELCDGFDNDCNGIVDDGFDFDTDPQNCGGCGDGEVNVCNLPNAVPQCAGGVCTTSQCMVGFVDADGELENGCETLCDIQNEGVELCNRQDDDCDGRVDEGYDLDTNPGHCGACNTACEYDNATGRCEQGRCVLRAELCDPGWVNADQDALTGCEYECTPSDDGIEVCNTRDDDCDTFTDEGFDIFRELEHCGGCGQLCDPANAIALCNAGECDIGGCDEGWFDANAEVEDGCELDCVPDPDGIETCNERDDDCDTAVDEDFDLTSDVSNCGACGNACSYPNGRLSCVDRTCRVEGCLDGWFDANGDDADGCELRCVRSNGGVEICDNRDNDCDGRIDEDFDRQTSLEHCGACNNACAFENAQARCDAGRCALAACIPGFEDNNRDPTDGCEYRCLGDAGGREFCNDTDDDCDGAIDEGFDLANDVDNCGACGAVCDLGNATPFCNGGDCAILSCLAQFADLDQDPVNGCECRIRDGGIELCDGFDNDCNGVIDDPERVVPPADFECMSLGICRGVAPTCQAANWRCDYGAGYEQDELSCDGVDNDCDGRSDEAFEQLGRPCNDGLGICREEGRLECAGVGGTACTATARNERARNETCNGLDDDCDGLVDEDSDLLVNVAGGGGVPAFSIYAYEASRTDSANDDSGQSFARACSKPDVLPWVNVDYATAQAACAAAGMRLCTADEWSRACAGPDGALYPYGDVYDGERCNGLDYDTDPLAPGNQDDVVPTGALQQCSRDLGDGPVFDLSGNVWEWTSEDLSGDGLARAVRGGSAGNIDGGLTCEFSNATPTTAFRANIGFRCCGVPVAR